MAGAHSRQKGARGEREAAELLGCTRNARNGLESCDLRLPDSYPWTVEVKRTRAKWKAVYNALDQALSYDPAKKPVALFRDDRREWVAVLRLEDVLHLFRDLAPGVEGTRPDGDSPRDGGDPE
jgi:hypothetical protein